LKNRVEKNCFKEVERWLTEKQRAGLKMDPTFDDSMEVSNHGEIGS